MQKFQDICPCRFKSAYEFDICPYGQERAKFYLMNPNSTDEEIKNAPGCPHGVLTVPAVGYCWYKLIDVKGEQHNFTDDEISYAFNFSRNYTKEYTKKAVEHMKDTPHWEKIIDMYNDGDMFAGDCGGQEDLDMYFPSGFSWSSVGSDHFEKEELPTEISSGETGKPRRGRSPGKQQFVMPT